jgi:effector-binding domain-containing protein
MAKVQSFQINKNPRLKGMGISFRVKMMDPEIPKQWDAFFKSTLPQLLEELRKKNPIDEPMDYVGLMYGYDPLEESMSYMIGMIMDQNTPDHEALTSFILKEGIFINAIIEGKGEVYPQAHELTIKSIDETKYRISEEFWSMEVYTNERFMKAMNKGDGSIVLDYRIPLDLR